MEKRAFSTIWDSLPIFFENGVLHEGSWIYLALRRARAYFRIQGKCPACPKSASYSDMFLPDSWKLKVLVTISLYSFAWCTHLHTHVHTHTHTHTHTPLQFLISSCRFWEHLVMVQREIQRFFTFMIFKKLTEMPPTNCEIHRKNVKEIL